MNLKDWEKMSIPELNKKIKGIEYTFIVGYAITQLLFGLFIFFGLRFDPIYAYLSMAMMFMFSTVCLVVILFYIRLIRYLKEITQ